MYSYLGTSSTGDFKLCAQLMKNGGNSVIAYVYTLYGERSLNDIYRDVDRYMTDYGEEILDGFFLDETMAIYQAEHVLKYQTITDYIRSKFTEKEALVIGNPGASPHYQTLEVSGMSSVVAFEQPFSKTQAPCQAYSYNTIWCSLEETQLMSTFIEKTTTGNIKPNQVATLIYATDVEEMEAALEVAIQSYSGTQLSKLSRTLLSNKCILRPHLCDRR